MRRREFIALVQRSGFVAASRRACSQPSRTVPDRLSGSPTRQSNGCRKQLCNCQRTAAAWLCRRSESDHRISKLRRSGRRHSRLAAELVQTMSTCSSPTVPRLYCKRPSPRPIPFPIAMIAINFDPTCASLHIQSLPPGGNVTGLVFSQPELAQKQLELLKQALPGTDQAAGLYDELSGRPNSKLPSRPQRDWV